MLYFSKRGETMKKVAAVFLLMITIGGLAGFPAHREASARPVHSIQRTTKKQTDKIVCAAKDKTYHRTNCRHHGFTNQIKLSEAQKKGYKACRICNP